MGIIRLVPFRLVNQDSGSEYTMITQPKNLSEEHKLLYQRRLAHFLRDFRKKSGIKAAEMAEMLNYSYVRYLELEKADKPQDRYIRSLEFIFRMASLKHLSLTEFITYLEEGDSKPRIQKSNWEEMLLRRFDKIDLSIKNDFVTQFKSDDKEKSELLLKILIELSALDKDAVNSFYTFLGSVKESVEKNMRVRETD